MEGGKNWRGEAGGEGEEVTEGRESDRRNLERGGREGNSEA